jgi:hypothetical protein
VVVVVHRNNDAEERADSGHVYSFSECLAIRSQAQE